MILVTGGGGFIGSHLVNELGGAGEAVRVLEVPGVDVRHLPLDAIQLARGDIVARRKSGMQCVIAVRSIILQLILTSGHEFGAILMR